MKKGYSYDTCRDTCFQNGAFQFISGSPSTVKLSGEESMIF